MKPTHHLAIVLLLAAGPGLACPSTPTPAPAETEPIAAAEPAPPAAPPRKTAAEKQLEAQTFAAQMEIADNQVDGTRSLCTKHPTSPLNWGRLAGALMTRARLSGDWSDYAAAEDALEKAFTIRDDFGPYMTRARLNYTLHRLDRINADVEQHARGLPKDAATQAADLAFAADVAFARGEYDKARTAYEASLARKETMSNLASFGIFKWKTGDFEGAEDLLQQSGKRYHGRPTEPHAWLHLHLGLLDLDRGRYDDALAHYREAEHWIRGYWLIDEHIAEILTLQGKTEEAKALYLEIIERTDNPEFMDAMAGILLAEGDTEQAKGFIQRARARFDSQLQLFPEAAYGHALEHFLEFGDDPAQTLELAQKNHTLRPGGEAKVMLARAYLAANRVRDAKKLIKQALDSPYSSAELHATAAEIYLAAGDRTRAAAQIELARAIHPTIEVPALEPSLTAEKG
jgi:tetratricopeptide (TPR) repeat protein